MEKELARLKGKVTMLRTIKQSLTNDEARKALQLVINLLEQNLPEPPPKPSARWKKKTKVVIEKIAEILLVAFMMYAEHKLVEAVPDLVAKAQELLKKL